MQYGARDKLMRKINVRLRFVSLSRAVEVAPVYSRLLYCAHRIHDILPSDTSNLGHRRKREKRSERRIRGKPGVQPGETCFLTRTFARCNQPDLIIPTRTRVPAHVFSRLHDPGLRSWMRPAHLAGRSEIKRISPPVALQPLGTSTASQILPNPYNRNCCEWNVLKRGTRAIPACKPAYFAKVGSFLWVCLPIILPNNFTVQIVFC